ncbi:MAG: class 1 fructose-bisphosphatase [Catalinimonas sp.]
MQPTLKKEDRLALPVGVTLDRFIMRHQEQFTYASGELSQLLRDIALAGKIINREINRAGLSDIGGAYGTQNIQGEAQQKLDVVADIRFMRALRNGGEVCGILSEEQEDYIDTGNYRGKYVVCLDPLDGSSNIDVNVSIGTIFSIYRRRSPVGMPVRPDDFLQCGIDQVAAGYVLYGSSTILVYTTGQGVNGFTYEPSLGEFILSHPEVRIAPEGKIYSCNEGYYNAYSPAIRGYIDHCKVRRYTARYIGSLVSDFHRNLLKGGVYLYPATPSSPQGKLRLLYECNALALLVEQAGGRATDGRRRILEIAPNDFHQRVPFFVGSARMVDEIDARLAAE